MTALTWVFRLVIFVFLLAFALQNTDIVVVRALPGYLWEAPLVVILFAFLMGGVLLGLLSLLGLVYRQRCEIRQLKRTTVNPENTPKSLEPPAVP